MFNRLADQYTIKRIVMVRLERGKMRHCCFLERQRFEPVLFALK